MMDLPVQEPTETPWYLSFTSVDGGSFSLRRAFYTSDFLGQTSYTYLGYEYRYNEGAWITTYSSNESFTESHEYVTRFQLNPGEKVEFRSNVNVISSITNGMYNWCFFQNPSDFGEFTVSGTPLSMINGDNKSTDMLYNQKYVFLPKFSYQTYYFTGLTRILNPDTFLPSTELAEGCYRGMFHGCTGLVNAPKLPATVMAKNCYNSMFRGCASLSEAPELPATTLAYGCYELMFRSCSNLVKAPVLPATTLDTFCYSEMFAYCSKLNYIKMLAAPTLTGVAPLAGWVNNVSTYGTFVKSKDATWDVTGADGVPTGWTVIDDTFPTNEDGFPESTEFSFPLYLNFPKEPSYEDEYEVEYILKNQITDQLLEWIENNKIGNSVPEDIVKDNPIFINGDRVEEISGNPNPSFYGVEEFDSLEIAEAAIGKCLLGLKVK